MPIDSILVKLGWLGEEIPNHSLETIASIALQNFEHSLSDLLTFEILQQPVTYSNTEELPEEVPEGGVYIPVAYPQLLDRLQELDIDTGNGIVLFSGTGLFIKVPTLGYEGIERTVQEISGVSIPEHKLSMLNTPRLAGLSGDTTKYMANVLTHELGHNFGLVDYHIPLVGYIPRLCHDRHCFMVQASGNTETLADEISNREYFCGPCVKRMRQHLGLEPKSSLRDKFFGWIKKI